MDDREWMYSGRQSQSSFTKEWIEKTEAFIEQSFAPAQGARVIFCPYSKCNNRKRQTKGEMSTHLCKNGCTAHYTRWVYHGEADRVREEVVRPCIKDYDAEAGVADMLMTITKHTSLKDVERRRSQREAQRHITTCCLRHRNPFMATQRFLSWMALDA
jgi:hypothetical protein